MTKIIAELCQNHQGDLKILEEMVHAASEAGADYCKIQSMLSKELTHRKKFDEGVFKDGMWIVKKRPYKDEIARLKPLDLSDDDHFKFLEICKKYNIKPTTTIFTRSRLKFIESLNLSLIKISSFDCSSHVMISEICKTKIPEIVVSTGATYDEEIQTTVKLLKSSKKKFSMLHCVSIYPTPLEYANLSRINYLRTLHNSVGFSDHSMVEKDGIKLSVVSLLFDVDYIERHFTILNRSSTKDGVVSLDPKQLEQLVKLSKKNKAEIKEYLSENFKDYEKTFGSEQRALSDDEILNRDYYKGRFASINNEGEYVYNWEDKSL